MKVEFSDFDFKIIIQVASEVPKNKFSGNGIYIVCKSDVILFSFCSSSIHDPREAL